MSEVKIIDVAVGIIIDRDKKAILISERQAGQSFPGYWEFPGGKCEINESSEQALRRELQEELGIEVTTAQNFLEITHHYPERHVRLEVWLVHDFEGEPQGMEGQICKWVSLSELKHHTLLEGNYQIVEALQETIFEGSL